MGDGSGHGSAWPALSKASQPRTEHLRLRQRHEPGGAAGLRHPTVLEEAHRLLRDPGPGQRGPAAKATELFAAMFAEVRAYGEGLVVAEQIPSKLIPDVVKNTAVKIVHRLPAGRPGGTRPDRSA
jgi:uncharacterized protein